MSPELRDQPPTRTGTSGPPQYDGTGVTDGPNMAARTTDPVPWTPCRRHLFETWAAIAPQHRHRANWRIPTHIWERIKTDPDMRCDWLEQPGLPAPHTRTLLGLPVTLAARGLDRPEITLPANCKPPRE
jgi:hypothetical protein